MPLCFRIVLPPPYYPAAARFPTVLAKAAGFPSSPSEGHSVGALSFRSSLSLFSPAASFAPCPHVVTPPPYYPAASQLCSFPCEGYWVSLLFSRRPLRLRIVLAQLGFLIVFPPPALLIVPPPLGFAIIVRRPLGFLHIPPKAAPFAHCPSAARCPYCPPAARFAYCSAAARLRYCPPDGRWISLLSFRRPLRLRVVLPPLGFLIVPPTSYPLWTLGTSQQAITSSSLLLFPRPGGMREAIK